MGSTKFELEADSHNFLIFFIKGVVTDMLLIMSDLLKITAAYFPYERKVSTNRCHTSNLKK
jgi:hypothetical protein